jgi:hypothetical protein
LTNIYKLITIELQIEVICLCFLRISGGKGLKRMKIHTQTEKKGVYVMITPHKTIAVVAAAFIALAITGCDDLLNSKSETISKPTANPMPGAYDTAPEITLHCATEGATIYYTTDTDLSVDDLVNGTPYTAPFNLTPFPGTLRAVAVKDGNVSEILTAVYTKTGPDNGETPQDPDNDVYVAGSYGVGIPCYWKNGVKTDLINNGSANNITAVAKTN